MALPIRLSICSVVVMAKVGSDRERWGFARDTKSSRNCGRRSGSGFGFGVPRRWKAKKIIQNDRVIVVIIQRTISIRIFLKLYNLESCYFYIY